MKNISLFVAVGAALLLGSCSGNNAAPEAPAAEVSTVAPAIEEPAQDQTIGQRIDTANAALQRKTAEVAQQVNDAADTAKKGVKAAVASVKENAQKAAAEVKSAAKEVKKEVKQTTAEAAGKVEQKAKAVKEQMNH